MTRSLSSCDLGELASLLTRAGVGGARPAAAAAAPVSTAAPTQVAVPAPAPDLVARVAAIETPQQPALGAALASLIGDLGHTLQCVFFVADADGLLLAGTGDTAGHAAALGSQAIVSLRRGGAGASNSVDAMLLRVQPDTYLIFSQECGGRVFVAGAQVRRAIDLAAVRSAVHRIFDTVSMRVQ